MVELNNALIEGGKHFRDINPSTGIFSKKIKFLIKIAQFKVYREQINVKLKELCANGININVDYILSVMLINTVKKPIKKRVSKWYNRSDEKSS